LIRLWFIAVHSFTDQENQDADTNSFQRSMQTQQ